MSEEIKVGDKGFNVRGGEATVFGVDKYTVWYKDHITKEPDTCSRGIWESRIRQFSGEVTTPDEPLYTGGSSDYYKVEVKDTTSGGAPYMAECNDIIEALGMNFAEGNAFKALWRRAAHRTLGVKKAGAKDDGLYDAEKVKFFGERLVEQSKVAK